MYIVYTSRNYYLKKNTSMTIKSDEMIFFIYRSLEYHASGKAAASLGDAT